MRRATPALAAVLAVGLLAGCGAGSQTGSSALGAAAAATSGVDSMRFAIAGTMNAEGASSTFQGEGVSDNAGERMSLQMTMENPLGGKPLELAAVLDGTTMYMRMPFLSELVPSAKPWIEFDLAKVGEEAGLDIGALLELGQQNDPARALDYLRSTTDVEELGTDQVRGVETARYRAEIDMAAYADTLEESSPEAAQTIRKLIEELGGGFTVNVEVWIDEDGLVRRQTTEQTMPDDGSMRYTMELYDFGADVDVRLPDPSDVSSLADIESEVTG